MVYLWNGRVHANDTWRMLEVNTERSGMKRLMEEATARHVQVIYYSASASIRVAGKVAKPDTNLRFWPVYLRPSPGGGYRGEKRTT